LEVWPSLLQGLQKLKKETEKLQANKKNPGIFVVVQKGEQTGDAMVQCYRYLFIESP
jgi:hypothetical protein